MQIRLCSLLVLSAFVTASPAGMFQRATVVQMDLVWCAVPHRSMFESLSGVPSAPSSSCAEYVLVSPQAIFRVQAQKSEILMLPGEEVSYRTAKGKFILSRDDGGGDLAVTVLCMRALPRSDDFCGIKPEMIRVVGATSRTASP